MNIYLDKAGEQLPGDLILRVVLRSDLAPIPRTLELTVRLKQGLDQRLAVGASLWAGYEHLEYVVVKTKLERPVGAVQGKDPVQAFKVTALLASARRLAYRLPRAVVARDTTLGAMFRACGAELPTGEDVPLARFASYRGQVPTFALLQALQEEAAALVVERGQLQIRRLASLFQRLPKVTLQRADSGGEEKSAFLERHEIPSFFSLKPDGTLVVGNFDEARAVSYWPRTTERELRNMSKVLVRRGELPSDLAQDVLAGDLISVGGSDQAVITAAHYLITDEEGAQQTNSTFWTGVLSV